MTIICFSGVPNAAKDCAADHLVSKSLESDATNYISHLKLADPLQKLTLAMLGEDVPEHRYYIREKFGNRNWKEDRKYVINGVKYSPRDIQIKVGKCLKEEFGMELFADIVYQEIKDTIKLYKDSNFVISDLRFPMEVEILRELSDVYFVYIDNAKSALAFINDPKHRDADGNFLPSEAHHPFLRSNADFVINNDGTIEEFYKELDVLYKQLVLKQGIVAMQHTPDIRDFLKSCNAQLKEMLDSNVSNDAYSINEYSAFHSIVEQLDILLD